MSNFFAKNIQWLRKQKGLNQSEASETLGCSRSTYSNYETGYTQPDFDKLLEISQFFDINVDDLLNEDLQKARFEDDLDDAKNGKKGKVSGKERGKVDPLKHHNYFVDTPELANMMVQEAEPNSCKICDYKDEVIKALRGQIKALELAVNQQQQRLEEYGRQNKKAG